MLRLSLVILFATAPTLAHASTFYVAKTGTDSNTCTQAQSASRPRLTIKAGLACLASADTLVIKAGTYAEGIQSDAIPSGKSDTQRTTVKAATGESVVINGANSFGVTVTIYDRSYVTLDGLTIDAANQRPVAVLIGTGGGGGPASHYITIQNGVVRNAHDGSAGCITQNGPPGSNSHLLFKNLEVHNCKGGRPQGLHGIYLTASDSIIEDCTIHDNDGHGIHLYSGTGSGVNNNIVRRNKVYKNESWGVLVGGGLNNSAYDNVVYQNGLSGDAGGMRIGYGYAGTNNRLLNNTVYGNKGMCIWIHDSTDSVVANNICYANDVNSVVDAATRSTRANNLFTDPGFVDAAHGNFSLLPTSPAIDAGKTMPEVKTDFSSVARPQGQGFDVGAFEFAPAAQPAASKQPRPDRD